MERRGREGHGLTWWYRSDQLYLQPDWLCWSQYVVPAPCVHWLPAPTPGQLGQQTGQLPFAAAQHPLQPLRLTAPPGRTSHSHAENEDLDVELRASRLRQTPRQVDAHHFRLVPDTISWVEFLRYKELDIFRAAQQMVDADGICWEVAFKDWNGDQKHVLTDWIEPHVWDLAKHDKGTLLVQKVIEGIGIRDCHRRLVMTLRSQVDKAWQDPHANHVLAKCMQSMLPELTYFIVEELADCHFGEVVESSRKHPAKHVFGCRVLQRALEHFGGDVAEKQYPQMLKISMWIAANAFALAQDRWGNYVVQRAFEHSSDTIKTEMTVSLMKDPDKLAELATLKSGSFVVQKALETCPIEEGARVHAHKLAELLTTSQAVGNTKFGSFAVKAARAFLKQASHGFPVGTSPSLLGVVAPATALPVARATARGRAPPKASPIGLLVAQRGGAASSSGHPTAASASSGGIPAAAAAAVYICHPTAAPYRGEPAAHAVGRRGRVRRGGRRNRGLFQESDGEAPRGPRLLPASLL